MHVEEDVSAAVAVPLHGGLLRAHHVQIVVGQPRLLLHIVDVADVMSRGGAAPDVTDDADEPVGVGQVSSLLIGGQKLVRSGFTDCWTGTSRFHFFFFFAKTDPNHVTTSPNEIQKDGDHLLPCLETVA